MSEQSTGRATMSDDDELLWRLRNYNAADDPVTLVPWSLFGQAAARLTELRDDSERHARDVLAALSDYHDAQATIAELRKERDLLIKKHGYTALQKAHDDLWAMQSRATAAEARAEKLRGLLARADGILPMLAADFPTIHKLRSQIAAALYQEPQG